MNLNLFSQRVNRLFVNRASICPLIAAALSLGMVLQGANAEASGAPVVTSTELIVDFRQEQKLAPGRGAIQGTNGLSLESESASASFTSLTVEAPAPFFALGSKWTGQGITMSTVSLRVRASKDAEHWSSWMEVTANGDMTRIDSDELFGNLVFFEEGARFVQYEITLRGEKAPVWLESLTLIFIDPGKTPEETLKQLPGNVALPLVSKPSVVTRSTWGCPDGQSSPQWAPQYTTVTHLIVHHTDTANSSSDWPAQVRSIWSYHTNSNDWGDIGYNYLIDPNGTVYEGRAGGDNVIGAHFSCMNARTMGVALLGNYSSASPTSAALRSLERLLAWKADQRGINPLGSSFHSGSGLTLANISGHRDGGASSSACSTTVCPGNTLYNLLPTIRNNVSQLISGGGGSPDLIATSLTAPTTGSVGGQINISSSIRNQGTSNAGAFRLGIYLSTNSTLSTGDTLLAVCDFTSGLAQGSNGTCNGPVDIPGNVSSGTYYLGLIVDDLGAVTESSESNNSRLADSGQITLSAQSYSVSVSVNGSGTVQSNPGGINCPGTCTANFPAGSSVTLSRVAAGGWTFSGWSGNCSGTGSCSLSMTANRSVTASFTQLSGASVSTGEASGVSQTAATLNGSIHPQGSSATAYFEWGTTTSYGQTTQGQSFGGSSTVPYSANLSGLTCGTQYHFRAVASSGAGASFGDDRTFTTLTCAPQGDHGYFTVFPCRIADTRTGPALQNEVEYSVQVAGICDIPFSATAVAANLTIVSPTGAGHVKIWPWDLSEPETSVINFSAGQTRANNAIVVLATDGFGDVRVQPNVMGNGSLHFILDVTGYFQ